MNKVSTRRLDLIPDIDDLEKICKSLFTLEKILGTEYNLFKFNQIDDKTMLYSFQFNEKEFLYDGENFFCIFFSEHGVIIIGYSIDSEMDDYTRSYFLGVLDNIPLEFSKFIDIFYNENSYVKKYHISYCIWRKFSDSKWNIGNIDFQTLIYEGYTIFDCSQDYLFVFDGKPESYIELANEYYGFKYIKKVNLSDVEYIYSHKPINEEIAKKINPDCNFGEIKDKLMEVGYPIA
jgi:hypothetical protein